MTEKRKTGRPSKYSSAYVGQAEKLCRLDFNDEGIAEFFGVDIGIIAAWAWEHQAFFDAITPTDEKRMTWQAERESARAKRNAAKRALLYRSPSARIRNSVSARMWAALRGRSDGALFSRLGYSAMDLTSHLEALFVDGMSWGNYGKWHVDHIRPCVGFDLANPLEFQECWDLSNLQPMWARDNCRKGASHARS